MNDDLFTEPDESSEEWVDVRMTDPDAGEWDVDLVVVEGGVEYVDLRIHPELLCEFVGCLVADGDDEQIDALLSNLQARVDEQ